MFGHVWNSAVAEHAASTQHAISWDEAKVIDSHQHLKQRCILEAWHFQQQAHTINRDQGQLPQAYRQLACVQPWSHTPVRHAARGQNT